MKNILVIGSSNIDHVVHVAHMPTCGETIIGGSYQQNFGGKGANQAYACGKLGGSVRFLSAVGDDALGKQMIEHLGDVNVDCVTVRVCEGINTGMAFINVDAEGDNSIVVVPGANAKCDADTVEAFSDAIKNADIVMLQLEIPYDAVRLAIRKARELGKIVVLDPAPAPEDGIEDEVLRGINYLTPNVIELKMLTDMPTDTMEQIDAAAAVLLRRGVESVVVTMGDKGVYLKSAEQVRTYPAFSVLPVDTTAAGDTFNAAMAVSLAKTEAFTDEVIEFANAAAALSTTRQGAQASVPSREETETFIAKYRRNEE